MSPTKPDDYFNKAGKYHLLADYYKYNNPTLHLHYYNKYVNYLQRAIVDEQNNRASAQTNLPPAQVRVMHAAPETDKVDVYVNSTRVLQDFPYKSVSNYLSLPQGKYQVDVYPAGNQVSTIVSRKIEVKNGKMYTIAAIGTGKNIKLQAYEDQSAVPFGEATLRVIHLSPDAPSVDIGVKNGDVAFPELSYRKATNYLGVTPMNLELEVRKPGTKDVIFSLPSIQLQPNTAYTIYLVGLVEKEPSLEALMLTP